MTQPAIVERSFETIMQFRCSDVRCAQCWSIADFDVPTKRWDRPYIVCPRCGLWHRLDDAARRDGVLAA